MTVKSAGLSAVLGETGFADNTKISAWAKAYVLAAKQASIISGNPDNRFRPQGNATRAEVITVIINTMK